MAIRTILAKSETKPLSNFSVSHICERSLIDKSLEILGAKQPNPTIWHLYKNISFCSYSGDISRNPPFWGLSVRFRHQFKLSESVLSY